MAAAESSAVAPRLTVAGKPNSESVMLVALPNDSSWSSEA
jgi:hypothetical protein